MQFLYYVAFKLMSLARYKWTPVVNSSHQLSAQWDAHSSCGKALILLLRNRDD